MMGIHNVAIEKDLNSYVIWGRGRKSKTFHEIVLHDTIGVKWHGFYTRVTDKTGFASKRATHKLLKILDNIRPDIIHLHNMHGYYLNIEMLFKYIRENNIKVVLTLHDCWVLTGHCAYFDLENCNKWRDNCSACPQKKSYPSSILLSSSKWNLSKKKELFLNQNIHIVTPSKWLKEIVKKSYLNIYPVDVIYNGIDLNIYRPNYQKLVHTKYSPNGKPIVLGVASEWTERKGLNDFISLASMAHDQIQFIVVGLKKSQMKGLPQNILGIERTNNVEELVSLYSVAEVFFNPTYEDNFPTTNIEALACGTPIVTYDTGGSPEIIERGFDFTTKNVGIIVNKSSSNKIDLQLVLEALKNIINIVQASESDNHISVSENQDNIRTACRDVAMFFSIYEKAREYFRKIYSVILE